MAYYSMKDDTKIMLLVFIVIAPIFLVVFLLSKQSEAKVRDILASDDPAGNLILALESKNPILRDEAEDALNKYGDPFLKALAPVCKGEPVQAQAYNPATPNPHAIVFMIPGGTTHRWTYEFLKEWGPITRAAKDVQLVVCVRETYEKLETCQYELGSERVRGQVGLNLEIYEVATGKLIKEIDLEGGVPRGCPLGVAPGSGSKGIKGKYPSEKDVREILAEFYR